MTSQGLRIAVLASGDGGNLQALIDACAAGEISASIKLVVSNNADAYCLARAASASIETKVLDHRGVDRQVYDAELAHVTSTVDPDLVVLAGWTRLLTSTFLQRETVINLHPSLPGQFKGMGCIEKTFEAFQRGEVAEGGAMVHYVPDEAMDDGPVISYVKVPINPEDTLDDYARRVHHAEHKLIVEAVGTALGEIT